MDDLPIVSLARLNRFEHRLGDAALVQPFLRLLGEAFAVSLSVVEDGDRLATPALRKQITCDAALKIVPANHAEHVGEALLGELRVGRVLRDHEDAGVRIDFRCRDCGAGALMAKDHHYSVGD